MTLLASAVLAHQGGWDEILLVLTPIALFAGLLWLANSRADKQVRQRATADDPDRDADDDDEGAAHRGASDTTEGDDRP